MKHIAILITCLGVKCLECVSHHKSSYGNNVIKATNAPFTPTKQVYIIELGFEQMKKSNSKLDQELLQFK